MYDWKIDRMINYIVYTLVISYLVLICMISMIHRNKVLLHSQRVGFITTFTLIMLISAIELVSVLLDQYRPELKSYNQIFLDFFMILSPLVPILYANSLIGFKNKYAKASIIAYSIYLIFIIVAIPLGLIFYVNEENRYVKGDAYYLYTIAYVLFKTYLVFVATIKIRRFHDANWFALSVLLVAFIAGSSAQLYNSTIHTSWASITLILIVYYAYYNEKSRQLDEMTGLYSHQAYLHRFDRLKGGEILVIMDCDNFKMLNDTYGHALGDKAIISIASLIKQVFGRYGICYRIGGDEFAAVLNKEAAYEDLIQDFKKRLNKMIEENEIIPTVSIGVAIYDGMMSRTKLKDIADKNMYKHKLDTKNEISE